MMEETNSITELIDAVSDMLLFDEDGVEIESGVSKFVLVMERIDEDGEKWLMRTGVTAAGDPVSEWEMKGMLHEALFGEW